MNILTNKLLTPFNPNRHNSSEKITHSNGMAPMQVIKINPIFGLFDICRMRMCTMFQNKLFKKEKRALVRDFLSDLDTRFPSLLSGDSCTFFTLLSMNNVFDYKDLLKDG